MPSSSQDTEEEDVDNEISDSPLPAWLDGDSLAPPCQADMDIVRAIIDFAGVTDQDVLFDLGCGDGRICIEAAESRGAKACGFPIAWMAVDGWIDVNRFLFAPYNARLILDIRWTQSTSLGVEIEGHLVDEFRQRVATKGLESKVSVIHGDLRDVDLSEATVVVIYLLPEAIAEIAEPLLIPLLRRDNGGSNAVSPTTRHPPGHWSDKGATPPAAAAAENDLALGSHKNLPPCRIVCNTWGIPGARVVRESSVGLYGGVTLRLFTSESLSRDGGGYDCGRA